MPSEQPLRERLKADRTLLDKAYAFAEATGIPLSLISGGGEYLARTEGFATHMPCHVLQREHDPARRACLDSHHKALRESIRWGEAYIGPCCGFFMQIVMPVMEENHPVACLVAAPFLMVPPSDLEEEELKLTPKRLRETRAFQESLSRVPVIKDNKISRVVGDLFQVADALSWPDLSCLAEVREVQRLQGKIADRICDLKEMYVREFDSNSLITLSYAQETELQSRIRLGDTAGAKEILYTLLAIILSQYLDNMEMVKISILELFVILSRMAVESGAKTEEILGMKYGYVTQLASFKDQERFCLWIVHVLERLVNTIQQSVTAKSDRRLRQAFEYVEANYSKRLPVDEVARHVSLSPSRLSHIMKSELGITLSDYVTRTRINKAKALLLETEMSVCQVALEVGYPDQSYFTKAFKALEGCTPKTFRHEGGQVALSPIPTRPGGRRRKSRQWTA